jgi:hypothetical protein
MIKALVDCGASESIITKQASKNLKRKNNPKIQKWTTAAGKLDTAEQTRKTEFSFPELHANKLIKKSLHVVEKGLVRYDMIIGRDLMVKLGLDAKGSDLSIEWDDAAIPWRDMESTVDDHYLVDNANQPDNRTKRILDASYKPADLKAIVASATHLSDDERKSLYALLLQYEDLFDGKLGAWNCAPCSIKLKPGSEPYHARPFPVPRIHELTLKKELDRLVSVGVLKRVNRSEWGAPTFIIAKKDGTVRFISDFRELNKRVKRNPFPIPKIQDLLLRLEGFTYGTSLDLNMGYYHIELDDTSKEMCTITTQWGKYEYQRLPMGLCNSADIFQEKMTELLAGLDSVRVYLDDLLHVSKGSWEDNLSTLKEL